MAANKQIKRGFFRWPWLACASVVVAWFLVFPPFHVLKKGGSATHSPVEGQAQAFEAASYAEHFWAEQLQPTARKARELSSLCVELKRDPRAAAKNLGHQAGVDGPWYFFLRGSGRIVAIEKSRVLVAAEGGEDLTIALRSGPIFGNVVRDGCALLDVNQVPGLQEYNALSAELNRLVETKVGPKLRKGLSVGMRLSFAGCAEAPESLGSGPALLVIPVCVEVLP